VSEWEQDGPEQQASTDVTAKISNYEFITIKGVEYSTSLRKLDLSREGLISVDIEPLRYMINLTELSEMFCQVCKWIFWIFGNSHNVKTVLDSRFDKN
jgi:hypothetical protein